MRASMHLGRLHDATQYRLNRLKKIYSGMDILPIPEQSRRLAYIAIELDNLNIAALREFTISTIRGAKSLSGARILVQRKIEIEEEIGAYILSVLNPVKFAKLRSPSSVIRTDEPSVRDPKDTRKVLLNSGASNIVSVDSALSLNSSLFRDIKNFRHFYAHRGKDTLKKVRVSANNLGVNFVNHPDEVLKYIAPGKSMPLLEEWIVEAKIFYELLMQ